MVVTSDVKYETLSETIRSAVEQRYNHTIKNWETIQVELPDNVLVFLAKKSFETGLPVEDVMLEIILKSIEELPDDDTE